MNIKKLFQHNKNREREMAVVAKKTEEAQKARTEGKLIVETKPVPSFEEELQRQAQSMTGLTSSEVTQENVSQACKAMSVQIRLNGNGRCIEQVTLHLPTEIRKVLQGRTAQETFEFYWSLETFREVWEELQFTYNTLIGFINTEVSRLGRTDLLEEL